MDNTIKKPIQHQPIFRMGIILLALSFGVYLLPELLHAFVPGLLLIYAVRILIKVINFVPAVRRVTWSFGGMVFLLIGLFTYRWSVVQKEMETAFHGYENTHQQ